MRSLFLVSATLLSPLAVRADAPAVQPASPQSETPMPAHPLHVPIPLRTPRYPLKTKQMLYSDAGIAQARANVARYPAARKVADAIIKSADVWLGWTDEEIAFLVTPPSVPRAFDVSAGAGCPKCGKKIYEHGTYPWIVDLKKPFKLTCPVDGTTYPSNDYETYIRSGFKTKIGWDTPYVDDGWGWTAPDGNKSWWVAHYNHVVWHRNIGPALSNLGRAYLLTGDKRYAHKAGVLLYHIAAVYPGMDHEFQSRYGEMQRAVGKHYTGKVINRIWETGLAKSFAECYDSIWNAIDGDTELQHASGKNGQEIRSFIEANLLEDAIDAYFQEKIRGNFGMHQSALVYLMLARQEGDRKSWLDDLMNHNGDALAVTGLNFALYNLVSRDGVPFETAPGYNFLWVSNVNMMTEPLRKMGVDLFQNPRMERFYEAPIKLVNIGKFSPDLGDSGSVYGGLVGKSADVFQTAYRFYRKESFARFLASFGATGDEGFTSFESLFLPPVASTAKGLAPQRARLLDGYGMGILSNPTDTISASMYYGFRGGHGHADRLGLQIFGANQSLLTDMGYPDGANEYVSGRYTWSTNTIAHNTVTVDARKQPNNVQGTTHLFADGPFARVLDVDGNGTYPQCSQYRRNLLMVDAGQGRSYYLDIFDVAGGAQHDYSLHGPPGAFETLGSAQWSAKAPGTLAGENVPVGEIYDNPDLQKNGAKKGYSSYAGSGFQHLLNVQRLQSQNSAGRSDWVAQWAHEKDASAKLRVRVLPQAGQEVMLADASVTPLKAPQLVKFVIARRKASRAAGGPAALSSRFVSIIEPFQKDAFIEAARQLHLDAGAGTAVAVQRAGKFTDVLLHDATASVKALTAYGVRTDAQTAVVTFNATGKATRAFFAGGTFLSVKGKRYSAPALPAGTVSTVDAKTQTVRIRLSDPKKNFTPASLVGRTVYFQNEGHRVAHPIKSARRQGDELILTTDDDVIVGCVRVSGIEKQSLKTKTSLVFAPTYGGSFVSGAQGQSPLRLTAVEEGRLKLASPLPDPAPFKVGEDVWLTDIGPGDRLDVPAIVSWEQEAKMKIYVLSDLEGVAGVNRWIQTREGNTPEKLAAMHLLTQEVNAAVDGILDAAPGSEIVVFDGHGPGGLLFEELHPEAKVIMHGDFSERDFGFNASFDALMFVGQHAMAGTHHGPLCHTFSSKNVEYYKVNGEFIGEFGCYAGRFGALNVPTIFLAGDDKACQEAQALVPSLVTVETKQGMGVQLALHLSAQKSREKIRAGAAEAIKNRARIAPFCIEPPYELEVRVLEGIDITPWLKRFTQVDSRTVVRRSDSFEALFR